MIVSYNWLNEWIDLDLTPNSLADKMTELGMEVDEVQDLSEKVTGFLVATVQSIDNAFGDGKNKVLKIDTGSKVVTIVTSASNVKKGDQIVWAAPGTVVRGIKIGSRTFGNIKSDGMALSLEELGLEEKSNGLIVFDKQYKNGTDLKEIPLFSDSLITYEITPNRGDLLSHLGVARELSAYFNKPLKRKLPDIDLTKLQPFDLEIRSQKVESYYCASVEGLSIAESPLWLKVKLLKCGMRPLYNVIDITNYVMLDTGQPMHAFDLDKIEKKIVVRHSHGESIVTLDEKLRNLPDNSLVIADEASAVAVAGVMGGESSKVLPNTSRILFEAAVFDPVSVRVASKKMNLTTDASFRFERGIDRLQTRHSLAAAVEIATKICGGKPKQGAFYDEEIKPKKIELNYKKAADYIGIQIDKSFVDKTLNSLGISKIGKIEGGGIFSVPSYRHDISLDVDLIEEIARFYGYDKIEPTIPYTALPFVKIDKKEHKIAELLVGFGFSQAINYSFIDKNSAKKFSTEKAVELSNPINSDQSTMRTSLIPGLLDNLITNLNYGRRTVKLFEIGTVFSQDNESRHLAILVGGDYPIKWYSKRDNFDFYDIKGVIELIFAPGVIKMSEDLPKFLNPSRSASIIFDQKKVGYIGELHPNIFSEEKLEKPVIVSEINLDCFRNNQGYLYNKIDKLLPIKKDMSFIVDKNIYAQEMIDIILEMNSVKSVVPFDLYQGKGIEEGKKSIAFNIEFDSRIKDDIKGELDRLADILEKKLGAKLRR